MKSSTTKLTVLLLLLAVAYTASAQRRGIRTCSCQIGGGHSQQGKLVGSVCYVVGVGSCRSFAYEGSSQQRQQFASQRRFSQSRFPLRPRFQRRYDANRPSYQQSQFNTHQSQFNQPNQFNRQSNANRQLGSSRPVSRFDSRYDIAGAAVTASPEQHRAAAEETRRQLESRRTFERELSSAGVTVRPGSPEAALASERRPDSKSAELGNKALAQILYLQSLLGRNGRR